MPSVRRPTFVRAFLPFWITLVWGALALMGDYHVRHAPLTRMPVQVTIEGQQPDEGFTVEVNGKRQDLNGPVPLGFAKIRIFAPDTEPKLVERFVWYGVTDLGSVDLTRSRGSLVAKVSPPPESYELTGKRGNWTNATGSFENVTAGTYELVSHFGSLSRRTDVRVKGNQTERLNLAAEIGALELVSEPAEGEFELWSSARNERRSGTFPATIPWLPTGPYQLVAKRPGYQREQQVEVRRNETNRVVVKFVYGSAKVTTTPTGATVSWAGTEAGRSPLTLEHLVPGRYQLETSLPGYDTVSREVLVEVDAPTTVNVALVKTRYREAMEEARQNRSRNRLLAAARNLEEALLAEPDDPIAKRLLRETWAHRFRDQAEELAQLGDFGAAIGALDLALKEVPDDAATIALRGKFQTAKASDEKRQTEVRFTDLVNAAKSAAGQQDFKKALALLGEAKQVLPDREELPALETAFNNGFTKMVFDLAEKRRLDEIADRPRQFKAAWELAMSGEIDADVFALHRWKTPKPLAEVRAALERIGGANAKFKVSDVAERSTNIVTAKLGALNSLLKTGYYARIGVANLGEGNTQILLKMFEGHSDIGPAGQAARAEYMATRSEEFRNELVKQLGSEVNPSR